MNRHCRTYVQIVLHIFSNHRFRVNTARANSEQYTKMVDGVYREVRRASALDALIESTKGQRMAAINRQKTQDIQTIALSAGNKINQPPNRMYC